MSESMRVELLARAASVDVDGDGCALTNETPLAVDALTVRRVWLTFGGPNTFVDVFWLRDSDVYDDDPVSGEVCYSWGSVTRRESLTGDEAGTVWRAIMRDADALREGGES